MIDHQKGHLQILGIRSKEFCSECPPWRRRSEASSNQSRLDESRQSETQQDEVSNKSWMQKKCNKMPVSEPSATAKQRLTAGQKRYKIEA